MAQPKIPILNLKTQYQGIQQEIEQTVLNVLRSGNYILGEYVSKLEAQIAEICGCKYGIGVANGTDALVLAVWALDIGPGDEVITAPFTFAATVEAIALRGARPVFVDVDADSFNIDPKAIEKAITPRTKAIMPVHLYGQPADMDPIIDLADRYGLKVIEDNAQAIGALYKGKPTGSFGDVACISFYPTKNLGAAGDAGMLVTNDEALAERLKSIRAHGMKRRYYHDELGVNSRLDELQAAILCAKLPHLSDWNARRQQLARLFHKYLKGIPGLILPELSISGMPANTQEISHVWHQFTVRLTLRDTSAEAAPHLWALASSRPGTLRDIVSEELLQQGIGSMCYYPVPLHVQTAFADLGYKKGDFPISETLADEVLSLPMYPELTEEQVITIANALRTILTGVEAENVFVPTPAAPISFSV